SVPCPPPQPFAHQRATIGFMNPSGTAFASRSSRMAPASACTPRAGIHGQAALHAGGLRQAAHAIGNSRRRTLPDRSSRGSAFLPPYGADAHELAGRKPADVPGVRSAASGSVDLAGFVAQRAQARSQPALPQVEGAVPEGGADLPRWPGIIRALQQVWF